MYARYSSRYQYSVGDQIRKCREWCEANGLEIDERHVFADERISGRRACRPGLDALKRSIRAGEVDVVVCLATSRLYRRAKHALEFADEYIVEEGMRCVFLNQGIDSRNSEQWQLVMQLHAVMDESQLRHVIGHIRAGQEGRLLLEQVHNTLGMPMGKIATDLGVNRDTVTKAVKHWHEQHGLPYLDGRARRKLLKLRSA